MQTKTQIIEFKKLDKKAMTPVRAYERNAE